MPDRFSEAVKNVGRPIEWGGEDAAPACNVADLEVAFHKYAAMPTEAIGDDGSKDAGPQLN